MRDRGPKVSREQIKLVFTGGHYGFERDAADGQWCDLWVFDDLAMPTGLAPRPGRDPARPATQRARRLRGLPPRDVRPEGPPRGHDREQRGSRDQLPQHLSPLRRPGLCRASRQGPRARVPAHLQRLDDRRVDGRRRPRPADPADARSAVGRRARRRRDPPVRSKGQPRGRVHREPRRARLPVALQRRLGRPVVGV